MLDPTSPDMRAPVDAAVEPRLACTRRVPLPDRRQNLTVEVVFGGQGLTVCMGFDPAGTVREVFAAGHKAGSDMRHVIDDACVIISIALQNGITVEALAKSLGRVPIPGFDEAGAAPASPIGAILGAIAGRPELAQFAGRA